MRLHCFINLFNVTYLSFVFEEFFCFNANLINIIPIIVANHMVDNLVNMTRDVATESSNPFCTKRKSAMLSLTPMPPGENDKTPYPKEVK